MTMDELSNYYLHTSSASHSLRELDAHLTSQCGSNVAMGGMSVGPRLKTTDLTPKKRRKTHLHIILHSP